MTPRPAAEIRTVPGPHQAKESAVSSQSRRMADIFDVVAEAYPAELARRRVQTCGVRVYEVTGEGGPLVPPGSILLATGTPDDQLLADLAAVAQAGDAQGVSDVISRIREVSEHAEAERRLSRPDPVTALAAIDTFGQVSYCGQLLAYAQMVTSDSPVSLAFLPFTGGSLPAASLSASHYHNSAGVRAETMAIVRQPQSSAVEARVTREFSAVSADELVGPARPEANWLAAAAFVGVVGAGVAGAYYLAREAQHHRDRDRAANEEAAGAGGIPMTLPSEFAGILAALAPAETSVAEVSPQAPPAALIQLRTELLKGKRIG